MARDGVIRDVHRSIVERQDAIKQGGGDTERSESDVDTSAASWPPKPSNEPGGWDGKNAEECPPPPNWDGTINMEVTIPGIGTFPNSKALDEYRRNRTPDQEKLEEEARKRLREGPKRSLAELLGKGTDPATAARMLADMEETKAARKKRAEMPDED